MLISSFVYHSTQPTSKKHTRPAKHQEVIQLKELVSLNVMTRVLLGPSPTPQLFFPLSRAQFSYNTMVLGPLVFSKYTDEKRKFKCNFKENDRHGHNPPKYS